MRRGILIALFVLSWLVPASAAAADDDDYVTFSGNVIIERDETVGDIISAEGDVLVRGTVKGDIVVGDGDITIRGTVDGDVVNLAGRTTLGRRADVSGDVRYGDEKPAIARGANVGGEVKKIGFGEVSAISLIGLWIGLSISLFLIGLAFMLIAPRAADAVAKAGRSWLGSFGIGVAVWIILLVLTILLLFTVVGIPLAIIIGLMLLPLGVLSYVMGGFIIGRLIVKKGARLLALLVGLLILQLLVLIPVFGQVLGFLVALFGLGAISLATLRARSA